ncbi:ribosomal biogenesis protein LAS1L isoform X2 [Xenopus laevis]|uniref:Ribosomal biogenesis protein LAS1L isoform X2 n=2 Tax=Xenopus laevis TaxID=8355 RepID=A0A1L8F2K9_XENLA|nr:ribosomal biogenesis protein LAS1L isoform X2 [Xenopus laevis]OCT65831.1 hypothetical protein XELAEV_18042081mg [Xenopus laevis]
MAGPTQVVAWLSKAEWEQVLEYLYSRDCKLQRDALHRISAWKSRYGNSMPLAVECTADLVRCKILDMSGGMGAEELVLLYGLALVRFVNLITERKQKTFAIPLRRLANELKIPEWVVNLRHDLTHGKLPKLGMCRKGWDCVMEWLRREYWSRQLGNTPSSHWGSDGEDSEDIDEVLPSLSVKEQKKLTLTGKLRDALRTYIAEQFKIFQELQQEEKSMKQWSSTAELEWLIAQVKDLSRQNRPDTSVETLLEEGFLIPTTKQLLTLKIDQEANTENVHVPRPFYRMWLPLLKVLHSQVFTQELLETMFVSLGQCTDQSLRAHYLSCWIYDVLLANQRAGDKKNLHNSRNQTTAKKKLTLFTHKVFLQWKRLMQKCLESPCRATPKLLKLIFEYMKSSIPADTQEQLLSLCSLYVQKGKYDLSVDYRDQPIYTVESLEWKIKQNSKSRSYNPWDRPTMQENGDQEMSEQTEDEEMATEESYDEEYFEMKNAKISTESRAALHGSAWEFSEELVKWGEYPLGIVPGQTEDPGCLLLDNYSEMSVLEQQGTETQMNGHSFLSSPAIAPTPSENLLWSQSELDEIKAGLRLF